MQKQLEPVWQGIQQLWLLFAFPYTRSQTEKGLLIISNLIFGANF